MSNNTYSDYLPMPGDEHLPPFPKRGEVGPKVCGAAQIYLGVLDDLTPEQVEIINQHVRTCAACAAVQRLMQGTTVLIGALPASMPSPRVDEAVMTAIAAQHKGSASVPIPAGRKGFWQPAEGDASVPTPHPRRSRPYGLHWGALASVAMAAVVLLSFLTMMHFMFGYGSTPQVFTLPATLSWNDYVIYHSETRIDARGVRYHVNTYYDPHSGHVHVETVMPGSMDVVAVGDVQSMLGMDMMHHVAQWEANAWSTDESMFNLAAIRTDMQTSRATFMDQDIFRGQPVYRIRCSNGLVLLLNMRYQPVNVLRGAVGPGTGEPLYDSLVMMPSSHVSNEMWDMRVPKGFNMGSLPSRP